jgi:hypothetical protein
VEIPIGEHDRACEHELFVLLLTSFLIVRTRGELRVFTLAKVTRIFEPLVRLGFSGNTREAHDEIKDATAATPFMIVPYALFKVHRSRSVCAPSKLVISHRRRRTPKGMS